MAHLRDSGVARSPQNVKRYFMRGDWLIGTRKGECLLLPLHVQLCENSRCQYCQKYLPLKANPSLNPIPNPNFKPNPYPNSSSYTNHDHNLNRKLDPKPAV